MARRAKAAASEQQDPRAADPFETEIVALERLSLDGLRQAWHAKLRPEPPPVRAREFLMRLLAWKLQAARYGGFSKETLRVLKRHSLELSKNPDRKLRARPRIPVGATLVREWQGVSHAVEVVEGGFLYEGKRYKTLSRIARLITDTNWSGPRFFGVEEELKPTIKAMRR